MAFGPFSLTLAIMAAAPVGPPPISGQQEPPLAAEPATPSSSSPAASASPEPARASRLAVYDFQRDAVDERTTRIITDAVVAEVRKLQRTSVISMDEVRAMLDLEAQKQMVGCGDESCLAEIADSLGVDGLVIGTIARVGDDVIIGLKRMDQRRGEVKNTANRRLAWEDGSELLAAVGPLVEECFPDVPLRPGQTRGVDDAIALRLHPPPVPTWAFYADAAVVTTLGVAGGAFAVLNRVVVADHDQFVAATVGGGTSVRGVDVRAKQDAIGQTAIASWVLLGGAAVAGISLAVLAPFTDWDGLADEAEKSTP